MSPHGASSPTSESSYPPTLAAASLHVLTSDSIPSLAELHSITRSLRRYKTDLEERLQSVEHSIAQLSDDGSAGDAALDNASAAAHTSRKGSAATNAAAAEAMRDRTSTSPHKDAGAASSSSQSQSMVRKRSASSNNNSSANKPSGKAASPLPSSEASTARPPPRDRRDSISFASASASASAMGRARDRGMSASRASPMAQSQDSSSSSRGATGASGASRPRAINIKTEGDRDQVDGPEVDATTAAPTAPASATPAAPQRIDATDIDIDDAPPSRPGRTYTKVKRKSRAGSARAGSAVLDSEDEPDSPGGTRESSLPPFKKRSRTSPQPQGPAASDQPASANAAAPTTPTGSTPATTPRPRNLGIKLKLNPTVAPSGITALGAAHRPLNNHGENAQLSGADAGGGSGFIWTLPEEPASLIPAAPVSRPPRPYPIRPDDVDEDFTASDWKERERQRDREELAMLSTSASASPAPGQTHGQRDTPLGGLGSAVFGIGSAAANRVRSQNQQQVTYQVFQTYVDSWFKSLTDEDIAWLGRKEADGGAFQIPPIGRHYKDVWEEEDVDGGLSLYPGVGASAAAVPDDGISKGATSVIAASNGTDAATTTADKSATATANQTSSSPSSSSSSSSIAAQVHPDVYQAPAFDPHQLADEHAFGTSSVEAKGGPLTERLLAMVLPSRPGQPAASSSQEGTGARSRPGTSTPAPPSLLPPRNYPQPNGPLPNLNRYSNGHSLGSPLLPPPPAPPQDMASYEERVKRELRFLDILAPDEEIDWSQRQDDEISATLRKVQGLLARQMRTNEKRKARLREIAVRRMAYQEYVTCLTNVEKVIEQGWYKRQSLLKKMISKKKTAKGGGSGGGGGSSSTAATATANGSADSAGNSLLPPDHAPEAGLPASPSLAPDSLDPSATLPPNHPDATDPYRAYNLLAQNRLPALPPLSDALVQAMRQRESLKRAFEPLFPLDEVGVRSCPSAVLGVGQTSDVGASENAGSVFREIEGEGEGQAEGEGEAGGEGEALAVAAAAVAA